MTEHPNDPQVNASAAGQSPAEPESPFNHRPPIWSMRTIAAASVLSVALAAGGGAALASLGDNASSSGFGPGGGGFGGPPGQTQSQPGQTTEQGTGQGQTQTPGELPTMPGQVSGQGQTQTPGELPTMPGEGLGQPRGSDQTRGRSSSCPVSRRPATGN